MKEPVKFPYNELQKAVSDEIGECHEQISKLNYSIDVLLKKRVEFSKRIDELRKL